MAQSVKDSKDYTRDPCGDEHRDQKDGSASRSVKLSSSASSESSLAFSEAFGLPPAPDGGWGWFVVLGAFFVSLICDGCAFTFGVVFVYLIEEFQETKSQTAWIASIFYCLSLLLGPVASALTTRFGFRLVTIAAGLVSCTGFVLSAFVTSIWQLYITFGVIVGAGFSVCYVTSVLTVAYYFDKRRALATGLAVCGTGIGTFTFAPLIEFLSSLYGWRGTFLIIGAIALNICVCGALFRPLTFTPEQRRQCHLNAFNRLTRPVSRLSIPSRNRSHLHSTNSESSASSSSDSEDDIAALAYSQIALPTYVNADKESIKMYLDKLPELRRTTVDPQLALQRFFKSRDIGQSSKRQRHGSQVDEPAKVTYMKHMISENDDSEEVFIHPSEKKRKRKNSRINQTEKVDKDKVLSKKTLQQLAEKLESSCDTGSAHRPSSSHKHMAENFECKETPGRALERTQSEKTPSKLACRVETGKGLERSVSDKIPASLICQGVSGAVSFTPVQPCRDSHGKVSTKAVSRPSSGVDPLPNSGSDMGMLLMNKHSTYLILHRNDIFFRGSYARRPVPCATSCPELSRLPSSDSESDDFNCLAHQCPCLQPVIESMEATFDKKIMSNPLFMLLALSNFLLYFWGDVPYVFAPDFAQSRGIPDNQATFLVSVIGIINTVGQVSRGKNEIDNKKIKYFFWGGGVWLFHS